MTENGTFLKSAMRLCYIYLHLSLSILEQYKYNKNHKGDNDLHLPNVFYLLLLENEKSCGKSFFSPLFSS